MGVPAIGEIALVPFPFSDLSSAKIRPALALANVGRGDWVLRQITTNPYGDRHAILLDPTRFSRGGLKATSFVRPGKLFTANNNLIVRSVAKLDDSAFAAVLDAVVTLLRPSK
jgi:mRNA interferase MazF